MNDYEFIVEALKKIKTLKSNKGVIECPKCKGKLHYTRAESNNHVWGNCETQDCIGWKM